MKNHAKKKSVRQESTGQLAFAAFLGARETLHAAVTSAGMTVLAAMLEEERTAVCGPRYQRDPDRRAYRAGSVPSQLAFGGRLVAVRRPRARTKDGGEVRLPTWEHFASSDPLTKRAREQMIVGVSTRKYDRSLEPAPPGVQARGASKSAVSRRFIEATKKELEELRGRDLSQIQLAALIIDALEIDGHAVLVALGVDESARKHVLGVHEGATENSVACKALLSDLEARGMRTDRGVLAVIDGSKALAKAVRAVFGSRAVIQRCQVHKRRNVLEHLPENARDRVGATISAAYRSNDPARAKRTLEGLARQLEHDHPSAAASLREGLDETLTVMKLGITGWLARTLSTTNPIEHVNSRIRDVTDRVDRWQGGSMILRWVSASLVEAARGFRRLRGHKEMPKLVAALRAYDAKPARGVDAVRRAA